MQSTPNPIPIGRLNDAARPRLEGEYIVYRSAELAAVLHLSPSEMELRFAQASVRPESRDGQWRLRRSDSRAFFSQFLQLSPGIPANHHIPEVLRQLNMPWARVLVSMYEDPINYPAALPANQGEFLRALVLNTAPAHILEIGCFTGISSMWMASALEELGGDGSITAVDLFEDICPAPPHRCESLQNPIEYVRSSLGEAGLQHRVTLVQANSHELGEGYDARIGRPIDLLYIDGDHSRSGALRDFYLYTPHVKIGGYVVLHDIHPQFCGHKGPRFILETFVRQARSYEMIEINTTPLNFGIAVLRKLGHAAPSRFSVALVNMIGTTKRWWREQRR